MFSSGFLKLVSINTASFFGSHDFGGSTNYHMGPAHVHVNIHVSLPELLMYIIFKVTVLFILIQSLVTFNERVSQFYFLTYSFHKEFSLVFVVFLLFLINSVSFPNSNNRMNGTRFHFISCHSLIFIYISIPKDHFT